MAKILLFDAYKLTTEDDTHSFFARSFQFSLFLIKDAETTRISKGLETPYLALYTIQQFIMSRDLFRYS
jgi:hypothetical protein